MARQYHRRRWHNLLVAALGQGGGSLSPCRSTWHDRKRLCIVGAGWFRLQPLEGANTRLSRTRPTGSLTAECTHLWPAAPWGVGPQRKQAFRNGESPRHHPPHRATAGCPPQCQGTSKAPILGQH